MEKACDWQKVVLIYKVYGKYFQGIGLLEVLWKGTTGIINWQINVAIRYHVIFHGFWTGNGIGIATLEAKLLNQIMGMR